MVAATLTRPASKPPALGAEPSADDFVIIFLRPANLRVSGVFVRVDEHCGQPFYVLRETNGPAETWLSFQSIAWPVRILRPAGMEV